MKKKLLAVAAILLLGGLAVVGYVYPKIYSANVDLSGGEQVLYIPTGATYDDVLELLAPMLKDPDGFEFVAGLKSYPDRVKPGRYTLREGWNNNALVNLLRAGNQTPVRVTFTPTRHIMEVAGKAARHLELDSVALHSALMNADIAKQYGFTPATFSCMFIPNTYEFYWNTNVGGFLDRMGEEYKRFWNNSRRDKATAIGLTPEEVTTLASIIKEEIVHADEAPRVAGVYLNRVREGWRLDADPTLKFANNDWTLRRVLDQHKAVDSPYNTYKYAGIPPGPITLPSSTLIDAVLNAEKHDYFFFVANSSGDGHHHFSRTIGEHNHYARRYQNTLNRQGIY